MLSDAKMSPKKASYIYQPIGIHEKQFVARNCCSISWFVILTCSVLSLFLVFLNSSIFSSNVTITSYTETSNNPPVKKIDAEISPQKSAEKSDNNPSDKNIVSDKPDDCAGKYIHILDIPSEFNTDLLKNCSILCPWKNMCNFIVNFGLGPKLDVSDNTVFSDSGWFSTDQFTVEIIFHNRMKKYRCLTNNSSEASAIYVPYYAGLDAGRYLWSPNVTLRDETSIKFSEYISRKPEWDRMNGRDHFLVVGRITWDFRRQSENTSESSGWGNNLFHLSGINNMTNLLLEASPSSKSEIAIPYPTFFHPSSEIEVERWQEKMRKKNRPYLFSFAGAPRPKLKESIRNDLIKQCNAAEGCEFMNCSPNKTDCSEPQTVMRLFQSSSFCLQPPGDSYTRKSIFDTIIAGCIPILLHPASAYVQYLWHLPKDYSSYSVFMPMDEVKDGSLSIEKRLLEISKEKVNAMREEVIKLIPRIVYANPDANLHGFEDAFEVTVKGVLDRVAKFKKERKNSSFESVPEDLAWKYNYFGDLEHHQWDSYFDESFGIN